MRDLQLLDSEPEAPASESAEVAGRRSGGIGKGSTSLASLGTLEQRGLDVLKVLKVYGLGCSAMWPLGNFVV